MSAKRSLRGNLWYVVATLAILAGLALLAQNVSASVGRESLRTDKTHFSNVAVVLLDTDTPTDTPMDTPTDTPTLTPTNTPTSTPGALLVGHVIRQGLRSFAHTMPISLTLTMGTTEIDYFPYPDSSNFFTVSVSSLAPGTYNYRARGVHFLSNAGTVTLTGAPITSLDIGTLRNGDSNNDDIVDMMDFVIFNAAFGYSCGSAGYDPRADYDNDCIVNGNDFTGFKNWYCTLGASHSPPPTPNGDAFTVLQPNITDRPGTCPAPPSGGTTLVGCTFALDLMVNADSRTDLAAQQTNLTFTYQTVGVTRFSNNTVSCVLTSSVVGDFTAFDVTMGNSVCNNQPGGCIFRGQHADNGSIDFHSGALSNGLSGGTFRVASIPMCALAPGQVVLHWQFSPPFPRNLHSDVVSASANLVQDQALYGDYVFDVVAPTATPTITPTPYPKLVGHVTIQGRPAQPDALQSVPITLTLKVSGGGTENNYSTNTDASGFFTTTAPGPGLYNWRIKNAQTLANSGSVTLPSSGTLQQEMGLLREGDANNDNCVSALDFNILKNSFGKGVGDPGYDNRAEFNGDNVVNTSDFNLIKGSFGQCGVGPIRPAP